MKKTAEAEIPVHQGFNVDSACLHFERLYSKLEGLDRFVSSCKNEWLMFGVPACTADSGKSGELQ